MRYVEIAEWSIVDLNTITDIEQAFRIHRFFFLLYNIMSMSRINPYHTTFVKNIIINTS